MTTKADIRKAMIEKRQALPPDEHAHLSREVCDRLVSIPIEQNSIIAGYKAARGEVDILQAMLACYDKKYAMCLPSAVPPQRIMTFLRWWPKKPMVKGPLGIMEPAERIEVRPGVLWIPLVAFDRAGYRLGYGGGYYDATLAHIKKTQPNIRAVGVAFAFQEVEALPTEAHDMKLDMVVTEREVWMIK